MEAIEEAATSTATSGRIDTKYACWSLTTEESQACESVVTESRHSVILLRRSENGVLFQMFSSEGFWLLLGPKDYACDVVYGTVTERDRRVPALPARTMQACRASNAPSGHLVRIEGEKWYFPDKQFTHELERLGFNRDDGIVHLMPVLQVVQDNTEN